MMLHRVVGKKTLPIGILGHHRKLFHVDENRNSEGQWQPFFGSKGKFFRDFLPRSSNHHA
jgi:hypothetical protein